MIKSVLFVHQGYELYGSDRSLVRTVEAVRQQWPRAKITVLLPKSGPLSRELSGIVADVRIVDLAVLRKKAIKNISFRSILALFQRVKTAIEMMRKYEIVYINTAVVLDYMIACWFVRRRKIVHIREIPPSYVALPLSLLMLLGSVSVIFNSIATQRAFPLLGMCRTRVIWNGVLPIASHRKSCTRLTTTNFLLIGRFNEWKGQRLLLESVALLPDEMKARLKIRLVGSVFEDQSQYNEAILSTIKQNNLQSHVELFDFAKDPSEHYCWADVVVVPSTRPEPFGLVAIEAMSAKLPVVASDHGGLSEIVENGVTGTLFLPSSIEALSEAIAKYVGNPRRIELEGRAGHRRFEMYFDESIYKANLVKFLCELTSENAVG